MSRYRTREMIQAQHDANPTPPVVCACDPVHFRHGWMSAGCKIHGLILRERPNKRATDANQDCAMYWGDSE